jgi:phospholipid transport system substrate-binding protein
MRRFLLGTFLALLVLPVSSSFAQSDPGSFIESLGKQTLKVLGNDGLNKAQKQTELERIFSSNVDMAWVGRFVMGQYWRQASEQQKTEYLKKYDQFLVSHYAANFTDYTSGDFRVTGVKDDGNGESTVSMEIHSQEHPNDDPILVDYRVRKTGSGFRIFDVIVEGVSLITTQRSEFGAVIQRNGIDYLIENLSSISQHSLPSGK